jgi:hypothetical protein
MAAKTGATKHHSCKDGCWFGEAQSVEDADAVVERHHQHHFVARAFAVGDGFAKVAHGTGSVAVRCP